ncbi:SigE family RNA polymerase sigma factor [Terrabacter aeriphilus]|uniref:SigE family RNA polymerase sigma factor n=1 Tax=Terrabacter aeriphilus TaxID=515662 RepID=A0ABP9J0N8_9MICO
MNRTEREAGFADYVAARRPKLYRTAYLVCGDPHEAEDLVQTALAKLYVAWPRVVATGQPDAYVRRVIVNAHLDEIRRPHRRRERSTRDELLDGPAGDPERPEDTDELWQALRALAPGQRVVVVLRHYWGLSVNETAETLGLSPGTVKSQTSCALERLRAALDQHHLTTRG